MHSYDESIEVRPGAEGPAMLIWRDRLWVVREIHACWTETAAWWDGAAARAVRGESVPGDAGTDLLAETEVWRVLADDARHRSAVLELSHGCATGDWRLRAVRD